MAHLQFLKSTLLSDVIGDHTSMVQVTSDQSCGEVLSILRQHNILSAPVFDKPKNQYVGIVDVFSLCWTVLLGPNTSGVTDEQRSATPVGSCCHDYIHVLEQSDTLMSFVKLDLSKRLYRALVKCSKKGGDGQSPYVVLSETDVIKKFLECSGQLGDIVTKPLDELNLVNPLGGAIVSITTEQTAREGFVKIFEESLNAIGVLDAKDGRLIGNLSTSDVRHLTKENYTKVDKKVEDFFDGQMAKPVVCFAKDNLKEVMTKAVAAKTHRIYIIDSAEKPLGVVTFGDIIRTLSAE